MNRVESLMAESPFFEPFSDAELAELAEIAVPVHFRPGETLARSAAEADRLFMLVSGSVRLSPAESDTPDSPGTDPARSTQGSTSRSVPETSLGSASEDSRGSAPGDSAASNSEAPARSDAKGGPVRYHRITGLGKIIGWSAMVAPYRYRTSAIAVTECRTLAFDRHALLNLSREEPEVGALLMRQVLIVLGARLRETRIRLVARRYDNEVLAIRALIDQNAEELSLTSPIHKLPVYLENRVTVGDAFHAMELLQTHGDELERELAELCLELMATIRQELDIYQRLQTIYEHVATAPKQTSPSQLRQLCSEEFQRLFDNTDVRIEGLANLPRESGQIFIMNHLTNNDENLLPNGFRLTIDTHFVSSMILYPFYGEAPIRVIRKANPNEFAHQMYYDRLGYIYVYRGHVDPIANAGGADTGARRREFLQTAEDHLAAGRNIVICPEGRDTMTENSPLPLRSGAFRLARETKPEPLIVPITVANFDKKLTRNTLAAIVHQPFRMSEVLDPSVGDSELFEWMTGFQSVFANYVAQTIDLTNR